MTARYSLLGAFVLALALATPAAAGWGPDGATLKATTNHIPKIAAVNDGATGSLVVWQEESSPGAGVLRAQHVLATGDVDPAWPADGMVLCSVATARAAIGVVADHLGGAYAWWKEGASLYLSRVDASGAVAAGWPARGRMIGATSSQPSAIEDGAHGIYVAWIVATVMQTDPSSVTAIHLGPANTGAGGWPNGVRGLGGGGDPVATLEFWPRLALAPDGGLFAAWAVWSADVEQVPSAYRLRRLTSAGLNAAGWDPAGVSLAEFHADWLGDPDPQSGLVALSPDGAGGVFALLGLVTSANGPAVENRIFRLDGAGAPAAGWPAGGALILTSGSGIYVDFGPDASLQVLPDGLGGAIAGQPATYDHGTAFFYGSTAADGDWGMFDLSSGDYYGHELVPNLSGGVFYADFYPTGPTGWYQPDAYLRVGQLHAPSSWVDFFENHIEIGQTWFGDIALAATGDGGAIFFWSQERERFGLFARRFNGAGEVTGAPPPASIAVLALDGMRFVAGEGVRARFAIPAGETAILALYDVGGRRVAAARAGAGDREITLPGTNALASGLYFAKLATARESARGRVVVTR